MEQINELYPQLYDCINSLGVENIPDQRQISETTRQSLKVSEWNVWNVVAEELAVLEKSLERGDLYDSVLFQQIMDAKDNFAYIRERLKDQNIDISKKQLKDSLIHLCATYPTLSYIYIKQYSNYPYAVKGEHPILIKEILANPELTHAGYQFFGMGRDQYIGILAHYTENSEYLKLLLEKSELKQSLINNAKVAKNVPMLKLLTKLVTKDTDSSLITSLMYAFAELDMIELFDMKSFNPVLINEKLFQIIIENNGGKILSKLKLDEVKIIPRYGSPVEIQEIITLIVHNAMMDAHADIAVSLSILSSKFKIKRFVGHYNRSDILALAIFYQQFDTLKILIEKCHLDIEENIIFDNINAHPLLFMIDRFDIEHIEYFLSLYDFDEPFFIDPLKIVTNDAKSIDFGPQSLIYMAIIYKMTNAVEKLTKHYKFDKTIIQTALYAASDKCDNGYSKQLLNMLDIHFSYAYYTEIRAKQQYKH